MTAMGWLDPFTAAEDVDRSDASAAIKLVEPDQPTPLFRRWSMSELEAKDVDFSWHIEGVFVAPTYGMISGESKTLKTYVNTILMLAIASGRPAFDVFPVPTPGPVVAYIGEGGERPYFRRLRRIAHAMDINLADIPFECCFDTSPVPSERFQESLARDLREMQPVLVSVDPFYAYHGTRTNAANLHEEGALLTALSSPVVDAGATLTVVNHFNKTGGGTGLSRITMSGGGEWSDTWLLLSHRNKNNVDVHRGHFTLRMEIGSRQWGGATWDLDINLGRFNTERGEHEGDISWHAVRANTESGERDPTTKLLSLLSAQPWHYTKTGLLSAAGGNATAMRAAFDKLAGEGQIQRRELPQPEAGRDVKRTMWATKAAPNPVPD